jgi:hypothetical protein
MGTELFQAEGQTDGQMDRHDEAKTVLSQFCKSTKKWIDFYWYMKWKNQQMLLFQFYL